MLPISASASQEINRAGVSPVTTSDSSLSGRHPTLVVALEEESIPAQDLAAPSPGASPSPAADTSPNPSGTNSSSGGQDWVPVAGGSPTSAEQAPAPTPTPPASQPPAQAPAEIAPAIDVGSIATTPQISDSSLAPLIDTAPTPARAASLRITEQQRVELERGHTDDAIRELAHAVSIDPSNSYAYFYLGRAYVARKDYAQAQTFFKRAEIGLASNSAWLGEIYAFEGLALEQSGKSAEAAAAYQKALAATPGNLTARVGVTRLSAFAPDAASAGPAPDLDQPAPAEPDIAPPPDEAPAPPPPAPAD